MADTTAPKTLDEGIANAQFEERKAERLGAGGGRALSPADAAGMGANKDQAKMAGASKPGALDQAMIQAKAQKDLAQEEMFSAIEREKNIEDEMLTPEQKEAQKMAEDLEGLGSLDNLVQKAIEKEFSTENVITADMQINEENMEKLLPEGADPSQTADLEAAFNEYNTMLNDPKQGIAAANAYIVSLQQGENPLINPDVKAGTILMNIAASIDTHPDTAKDLTASAIAEGIVDVESLSIEFLEEQGLVNFPESDDDEIPEFGFSKNQLQGILGPEFATMTVEEIGDIVENKVLTEIHQTENLQKAITDPNVSPVLREALQGQLAQVEASGMAAIEQDADNAAAEVMAAGSVLFGGEVRPINDLLDDDSIKAEVEQFLMMDPDTRMESPFAKENLAFANTMTSVFQGAMEAGQDFEEAVGELKATNEEYKKQTAGEKESMPEPPKAEILALFGKDGKGLVATIPEANEFWSAAQKNDSIMRSMNRWPKETIDKFGTWMKDPKNKGNYGEMMEVLSSPESSKAFFEIANIDETLRGINPKNKGANQALMNTLFSLGENGMNGTGFGQHQFSGVDPSQYLDKLRFDAWGNGGDSNAAYKKFKDVLDSDGDGKQDSPKQMKKNIAKFMKGGTMEDMMASAKDASSARQSAQDGDTRSTNDAPSFEGGVSSITVRDDILKNGLLKKNGKLDAEKLVAWAARGKKGAAYLESVIAAMPGGIPGGSKSMSSTIGKEISRLNEEAFSTAQGTGYSSYKKHMFSPEVSKRRKKVNKGVREWEKKSRAANDRVSEMKRRLTSGELEPHQMSMMRQNLASAQSVLDRANKNLSGWKDGQKKFNDENKLEKEKGMESTLKALDEWEKNGTPSQKAMAKHKRKVLKQGGWL